ncbi:MAG: hypothetical protein JXA30_12490 [Deltaproteobacteria bacterium]|nr:hypothetical protein [Deltaproteobacteria bacterium]
MQIVRKIRGSRVLLYLITLAGTLLLADRVCAAGGGKPATKLVCVADTRNISGIAKWIGDIYNTNYWLFGLTTVVVMAGMGLFLGLLFDRLLQMTGLKLGKLDHHE